MSEQAINHIRGIKGRTRVQNLGRISAGGGGASVTGIRKGAGVPANDTAAVAADIPTPLTTKGDLFGFDTAATRIPVGSIGQALLAQPGASTGVSWQTVPGSIDALPSPANAQDDEFSDLTGQSGPVNGLNAKWTLLNNTNLTNTFSGGFWRPSFAITVNAANSIGGFTQALPAVGTDFSYFCKTQTTSPYSNTAGAFGCLGLFLRESSTAKISVLLIGSFNTNNVGTITLSTAQGGSITNQVTHVKLVGNLGLYLRVRRVGIVITWSVSSFGDGQNFLDILSENNNTSFTTAPDQVGICCYGFNTAFSPIVGACDYFRRTV